MNIAELKLEIIARIIATDDMELLLKINNLLINESVSLNEPTATYEKISIFSDDEVHIFTPKQRKRLLNSLEQSKKGNTMTDEEANADIQKWL